ncbi:unnamed protein product [Pieris macdunnoughi]|uniref:START domain-containing protein n=1 Tax=Pieris macdunnoughi TaxID=345717 RepID=A0A821KQI0_9NEOP|nr:unnamed protein product [Pieris macdunnoughi]
MASIDNSLKDSEVQKHLNELENVATEEELEKKLEKWNKFGFNVSSWMKYLFNHDSGEGFKAEWLSIDEYKRLAEESMQDAWRVVHAPSWKLEKRGSQKGDIVESTQTEKFGKVYRFTGIVDCPAKFLYSEFRDNLTRLPEWNPTILKSELIKEVGPGVDLSYQVTAGGGRGIIAPRDFVILRRTAPLSSDGKVTDDTPSSFICSGVSVTVPGYPPHRDMVRGHNKVGCWFLTPKWVQTPNGKVEQTVFQWLMCCDLKGKIPQFVLDAAFATVMLDYIVHVRAFAASCKAKGMF